MKVSLEGAKALAEDLLFLEITLASRSLADRVATPDQATQMAEVSRRFAEELAGPGTRAALKGEGPPPDMPETDAASLRASLDWLVDTAERGLVEERQRSLQRKATAEGASLGEDDSQQKKLLQMRDYGKNALQVMDQAQDPDKPWDPRPIIHTRKVYELLQTDRIYMRTLISMDGDVIALVGPDLNDEASEFLLKLHEHSVSVSVDFWKELIHIVQDFVSIVLDRIFPRLTPRR